MQATAERMTLEDYLANGPEWPDGQRVEWINDQAYAMSGASALHAAVTANAIAALTVALRGSGCRATTADQRVWIPTTGAWLYPDVTVICGPYEVADEDRHSVTNPTVVVEVLSPSTRSYELGAKGEHYRSLPTLQHLLFVDPVERRVALYTRTAEGWLLRDLHEGEVPLEGVGVSLPLAELFADLAQVPTTP